MLGSHFAPRNRRQPVDPADRRVGHIALLIALVLHALLLGWLRSNLGRTQAPETGAVLEVVLIPQRATLPPPPSPPPPIKAPPIDRSAPARRHSRPTVSISAAASALAAPAPRSEDAPAALDLRLPEPASTSTWRIPGLEAAQRERRPAGAALPGRTEAYARIEGMRERKSPADVVNMLGRMLFGAGARDGCPEIEDRLGRQPQGVERDIDLAKWRKQCAG